ncbi:hypothetical protein E2320_020963 [Naja naja]|nr:hypothetical protein E2320_020963 [Naja naja]
MIHGCPNRSPHSSQSSHRQIFQANATISKETNPPPNTHQESRLGSPQLATAEAQRAGEIFGSARPQWIGLPMLDNAQPSTEAAGPYPDTPTAADVVNALDQQALASILKTYGEEKHAKKIASTIVQARSIYPITRTRQLASIIAGAFPETILYARKDKLSRPAHIATKTFQALRIFVNNELHELYEGLKAAEHFLKPGGRLVAITFHSLEDRIVKRFLHGIDISERFNLSVRQKIRRARMDLLEGEDESLGENYSSKWKLLEKKALTPQDTEIKNNPRGRSAKLRGAIKL